MNQNISEKLEKVRRIEERAVEIAEVDRPVFHMSSPLGWLNDPNGFSMFKGDCHLFFQYHPYSTQWGPMHWGHCVSKDFVQWEYLPAVMAPDEEYDNGGCYSGSAIGVGDEHVLIYTGVIDRYLEDGTRDYRQVQCMAKGDGVNYQKWEGNPIIPTEQIPEGASIEDFRDPKIWKEEDAYYLVAGSRAADGAGQIVMYRSENLENWEFVTVLDQSKKEYGMMWECPDFFPLGDKQILITSPQDMRAQGYEFFNGNHTIFLYGDYDKETHTFKREKVEMADYGLDFYAPQTLETEDGRRIMIAWMQSWDSRVMPEATRWSGMMTFPRELTMKNGKIYQTPVRELENYRVNRMEYKNCEFSGSKKLEGIEGRVIDMEVTLHESDFSHFAIHFAKSADYEMVLQYNPARKVLTIDRTDSGLVRDVVCRRKMTAEPMIDENGEKVLKLRLLMDRFSVEVFINDGEKVSTSIYFTPVESDGIEFEADGTVCMDVVKYDVCGESL